MKKILIILIAIIGVVFTANAQVQKVWGVIEYNSTIPPASSTGAKIGFRALNNSVYYWNGSQWIRIAGPGIVDTNYNLSFTTPNLSLVGSGSTISLTNLYTAGYGLIKTGETWKVDTSKVATRFYVSSNPTSIAANYLATSNGTSLVARNLYDDNNTVSILNSKPFKLGQWTTAGRPTGVDGYSGRNTTTGFDESYYNSEWRNLITSTGASANQVPYFTSAGQIAGNTRHIITPSTGAQTITFNNTGQTVNYLFTGSSPIASGVNWGIRYTANGGNLKLGLLNDVWAALRWNNDGSAALEGVWSFPSGASYPSPMYMGSNTSGANDVRIVMDKSGNGANQTTYLYTQRTSNSGGQPRIYIGATQFAIGTKTATSSAATIADTSRFNIAQNGDVRLSSQFFGGVYPTDATARLQVVGRGAATTYPLLQLQNTSNVDRFSVLENGKISLNSDRLIFSNAILRSKNVDTTGGNFWGATVSRTASGVNGWMFRDSVSNTAQGNVYMLNNRYNGITHQNGYEVSAQNSGRYNNSMQTTMRGGNRQSKILNYHYLIDNVASKTNQAIRVNAITNQGFKSRGDTLYTGVFFDFSNIDSVNTGSNYTYQEISSSFSKAAWLTGIYTVTDPNGISTLRVPTGQSNRHHSIVKANSAGSFSAFYLPYTGTTADGNTANHYVIIGEIGRFSASSMQLIGYGVGAKTAAALSKTQSNYISSFATDGTLLDLPLGNRLSIQNGTLNTIRPTQDTFIQDVALFSVGTLLNSCNELVITTSMTSTAPSNMEIRLPDPVESLRGKKITVYSSRKDAGAYVPYISVTGGVSKLFYTTNSSITGSMPTSQATLFMDNTTWSNYGASYEWTCQKTDNTPTYRWVLNQ